MKKKKITIDEARSKMFTLLGKKSMGDAVYELAQDIFQSCINVIETNNEVIDNDVLDRDEEWYDEIQDEFYQQVYNKLIDFLKNGE